MITTRKAYEELKAEVKRHDRLYFKENKPEISDTEYDKLYKELVKVERKNKDWVERDSPTQRRGDGFKASGAKEKHVVPMLSIEKAFEPDELESKLKKILVLSGYEPDLIMMGMFFVEPKLDGLAIDLEYIDGVLNKALTRGTGDEGEDVTAQVATIASVPLNLNDTTDEANKVMIPNVLHVRGEVLIKLSDFEKLNEQRAKDGLDLFKNPRNAAAGLLRTKNVREMASAPLTFYPYRVPHAESEDGGENIKEMNLQAQYHTLQAMGFLAMPGLDAGNSVPDTIEKVNAFGRMRKSLDIPTDGCVIKLPYTAIVDKLGEDHRFPRWAVAYKYEPEQAETTLKDIILQVGQSGIVAPVADLEPVEIDGSVVSRASVHNKGYIATKDLRIGDTVVIEKAGDIIPAVVGPVLDKRPEGAVPYQYPTTCAECGHTLVPYGSESNAAHLKCPNKYGCPGQIIGRLKRWVSKDGMDLDAVGPEFLEEIVRNHGVRTPADLYLLDENGVLDRLPNFGKAKKANLLLQLEKSKDRGMEHLLYSLCIHLIGTSISKKVGIYYPSLTELRDDVVNKGSTFEDCVKGKALESLKAWFEEVESKILLTLLKRDIGINFKSKSYNPNASKGVFSGKTFVITGELTRPREYYMDLVRQNGGRATTSVSGKTSYLVVGEEAGKTKLKAAEKHNVPVIDEAQFNEMLTLTQ